MLIVGESAVGKTSLMLRYADNRYAETFISTIGVDFKTKLLRTADKTVKMQIWDTGENFVISTHLQLDRRE